MGIRIHDGDPGVSIDDADVGDYYVVTIEDAMIERWLSPSVSSCDYSRSVSRAGDCRGRCGTQDPFRIEL